MFDAIADKYDMVNRVLSLGLDQSWRRRAVRSLELGEGTGRAVLDLATGTADLALLIARLVPGANVIGVDPSSGMLNVGRKKVAEAELGARIDLREGDAESLDLPDASVSAITMAFGIRNVPDRAKALREMARVTKPGGRIAILELAGAAPRADGRARPPLRARHRAAHRRRPLRQTGVPLPPAVDRRVPAGRRVRRPHARRRPHRDRGDPADVRRGGALRRDTRRGGARGRGCRTSRGV